MTMTATEIRSAAEPTSELKGIRKIGTHFLKHLNDYLVHRKARKAIPTIRRQDEIRLERAQQDVNNFWQGRRM